ncbi:MAG: molybdopterin molybdenumtransferase MoeA, partial [Brachybacterium sp.]|nr:molybdopterin molybdenumtransferase MoeA [Brachybacterium sp.]
MAAAERIPLVDHVADARALLAAARRREVSRLDGELVGRVAATELRARVDVPGHDNSQMDGYALASADVSEAGGAASGGTVLTLPLGPTIAAGDPPGELSAGTARPIMTGAPIPVGADLVIPVEESAAGRFEAEGAEGAEGAQEPEGAREERPRAVTLAPRSA